jgi:EmrB/QacA subfamily drug resistance transporter
MSYKSSSKLQWLALFALGLGYSLIYLDTTALNIALPDIQHYFKASDMQLFWINNGYTLAVASFCLAGGRLGDIFGIRRIFLSGLVVFGLGSLGAGFAFTAPFLIGARALQGIGGAITLATSLTAIYHIFPVERQGRAMGIFSLSVIFFILVGPTIGGILTQFSSWRWIFWINPIIGTASFIMIFYILKGLDEDRDREASFDFYGQLLFMGTLIPLIFALMQGPIWGWGSAIILSLFGASVFFLILFVIVEIKKDHPLFDLTLFKNLNFKIAMIMFILMQFPLASSMYNALYLQNSLGFTPALAGIALLPSGVFSFFGNPIAGRMVDSLGYKRVLFLGFIIGVAAYLWLFLTAGALKYIFLLIGLFVVSLSMPLIFVACFAMVMRSASPNRKGMVSGISVTMRQTGGAICVALMGILTTWVQHRFGQVADTKEIYARSFQLAMGLVALTMLIGVVFTFWIDKKIKLNLSDSTSL